MRISDWSSDVCSSDLEAAGVLTEMPRRAHELAREIERQAEPAVGEVEVQRLDVALFDAFLRPGPDLRGQRADKIFGEAERLADVAQRALGAIADDRRAERGMVAAVGVEHPLHDEDRKSTRLNSSH